MRLDYVARPAGTKPAAVYWRRRAIVLGICLLLVWFTAKACGGSGSASTSDRAAGASASAQPSAAGHATAPARSSVPSAAAVGTPGSTGSTNSGATGTTAVAAMCDGSALSLRAAVDRLSFRRPFTAGITLQIATRSPSPCGLDASALQAQVLDGSRVLWSSDGCAPVAASPSDSASGAAAGPSDSASGAADTAGSGTQSLITVPSQSAADQHFTWHGNVCSGQLAPGRYDVVGRLGLAEAFAGTITVT